MDMTSISISKTKIEKMPWDYVFVLLLIIPLSMLAHQNQAIAQHWPKVFKPATLLMIQGKSPYENQWFFNPPWALIPFIPFALLPDGAGEILLSITQLFLFYIVSIKMGAKPLVAIIFATVPYTLVNAFQVNIDAFVALGFIMPPWIGLFFVLAKPQIGIGLAIYWGYEAWKDGGAKQLAKTFLPVLVAFLASFVLYGPWMGNATVAIEQSWNSSSWPLGLILASILMVRALRMHSAGLSMLASPFLSPYFALASLGAPLLGLLPGQIEMIAACAAAWLVYFMTMPSPLF